MSGYRLSEQADRDLEEIWDYIARDNEVAADRTLDNLTQTFQTLAHSPNIGQRRNDLRADLRLFPAGSYVIFYHAADDGIEVVGVIHGQRDIDGLFQRGER